MQDSHSRIWLSSNCIFPHLTMKGKEVKANRILCYNFGQFEDVVGQMQDVIGRQLDRVSQMEPNSRMHSTWAHAGV